MMRMTARLLPVLLLLLAAAHAASAGKRVALVIGNGKYIHAGTLANPANDASDIAAALKGVGFTVVSGFDLDKPALEKKIREFASSLAGADTGVFFYAGHGLQVAGTNYIVPVDAQLTTADALEFEMVKLESVQRIMENAAKTNILFLDACRNNPLARNLARALGTRGSIIGTGLAPAESGIGTLISFSTQPGNVAADGSGRNSPFTGPLVKRIAAPGEDILTVLTAVRNEVLAATGEKQVPWENHALRARFYFNPTPAAPAAPPQAQAPMSEAANAWAEIKNAKDVAVFEAFRKQYGPANALYDTLAAQKIAELKGSEVVVAVSPKPVPARPPEEACEDGLLVTVATGPNPCIKPGSGKSFKDCPECPEMVIVPASSFMMGSPPDELERGSSETQHKVTIAKPFAAARFAVTFAEWDACVEAGGCGRYRPNDQGWGRGERPVINVSWADAKAYVKWVSRKTGRAYRLLSEAEREYVTRAGTRTPFWWGTSITETQANYDTEHTYSGGSSAGYHRQRTLPVKSFQPNPWGLYQVHGNIWEWAEDCWNSSYNGASNDGSAWTTGDCKLRVHRGGSWNSGPVFLRAAFRYREGIDVRSNIVGFRLARTLD
jgi:formylglycine-generating enzyme required for sulfatase activity